jgi:hypothetical protein
MKRVPALLLGALAAAGAACTDAQPADGTCALAATPTWSCGAPVTDADGGAGAAQDVGLVAYACTGTARPDDSARYVQGVPEGMVCADVADPSGGAPGYCCTAQTTDCAYDPVAICNAPTFGYQCRGADRPESLNPLLTCGQGIREGDYINYCCSGTPQPDGCTQTDAIGCSSRLMGWTCTGTNLPRAEELGSNKSRADYYYLLCPTPTPAGGGLNAYCCYTPALVPIGGSCVEHTSVPGCAPGRFGFACYGPDTPEDDYAPMHCPDPGFPGTSAQGFPATLYCCDFQ